MFDRHEMTTLTNGSLEIATQRLENEACELALALHYSILYGCNELTESQSWYEHPDDWWQAFRARWFPKWWLKRYPVKNRVIPCEKVVRVNCCPHLPHNRHKRHHMFLMSNPQPLRDLETDHDSS